MTDPVVIAQLAIQQHYWVPTMRLCMCQPWDTQPRMDQATHETHRAEAVISALSEAGFTVLPTRLLMAWQKQERPSGLTRPDHNCRPAGPLDGATTFTCEVCGTVYRKIDSAWYRADPATEP